MPWIKPGNCDVAAQRYSILELGRDPEKANNVSVVQLACQAGCIQRQILSASFLTFVDSLHDHALSEHHAGDAAGINNGIAQSIVLAKLKNSGIVDSSRQ